MARCFDKNIMCELAHEIFTYHRDSNVMYEYNDEAEDVFEEIVDKYNEHYNNKFNGNDEFF